MKVTAELIKKYHLGRCSPEEALAVEQWLNSSLKQEESLLADNELEGMETNVWRSLSPFLDGEPTKVVPLHKRVLRYAAVACLIIGAFFIGYFAALPSAQANTVKKDSRLTDVLYIYGGEGAYGIMNRDRYQVRFEGTLRLHNSAHAPKHIVCGEQEFTLEPHKTYILSGSDQNAHLTDERRLQDTYNAQLKGGFSTILLDE
ncbi:MAG: hypothetical protein ACFB15_20265 [Cyclobacteriaceae bacterium]